MIFTASGLVNQGVIDSAVRRIEREFALDVVRIGYTLEDDSTGAPAIFFRILVRDEAAPITHLKALARRLLIALMNEVRTDENGLRAVFNYRTVSEQQALQDPAWA